MLKFIRGIIRLRGKSGNLADVDASGNVLVKAATPVPPPGTNPFVFKAEGDVGGTDVEFASQILPSGESLTVQAIEFSTEADGGDRHRLDVYYSPDASGPVGDNPGASWTAVDIPTFQNIGRFRYDFNDTEITGLVGDGTARLWIRRERLDGGTRYSAAIVRGFTQ